MTHLLTLLHHAIPQILSTSPRMLGREARDLLDGLLGRVESTELGEKLKADLEWVKGHGEEVVGGG